MKRETLDRIITWVAIAFVVSLILGFLCGSSHAQVNTFCATNQNCTQTGTQDWANVSTHDPQGTASSGTTGVDSFHLVFSGSQWNGSAPVIDSWEMYNNAFSGSFANGSNFIINHINGGGSGRLLALTDIVVGNPRSATASLNSNSFAFDNQGAYFESGSNAMLWEMGNTVSCNGCSLATTIFRQNFVPIFNSTCSGCQGEFALGGSGTLSVSGNYSGPPKWLFTNLRSGTFNTASFEHSNTAPRLYTFPDVAGTVFVNGFSALQVSSSASGGYPQGSIVNSATGGVTAFFGVTDTGNAAGGGKYEIGRTSSSSAALVTVDLTNNLVGINQTSPAFMLDVNGVVNGATGLKTTVAAFSALPSCAAGTEGQHRSVSDSTTNTWGATITGSGANHVLAYCDGTNWTVMAK